MDDNEVVGKLRMLRTYLTKRRQDQEKAMIVTHSSETRARFSGMAVAFEIAGEAVDELIKGCLIQKVAK